MADAKVPGIEKNPYAGRDLLREFPEKDEALHVLILPKGRAARKCPICGSDLAVYRYEASSESGRVQSNIPYCRTCSRIFVEEQDAGALAAKLDRAGIERHFYTGEEVKTLLAKYRGETLFFENAKLFVPTTWIAERPTCPVSNCRLHEKSFRYINRGREILFTGYHCGRCGKNMIRPASQESLERRIEEEGLPRMNFLPLSGQKKKKALRKKSIHTENFMVNGLMEPFDRDDLLDSCHELGENDLVEVCPVRTCDIPGHTVKEVLAQVFVLHADGEREAFLFVMGYCAGCNKYLMDWHDYKTVTQMGRLEADITERAAAPGAPMRSGEKFREEKEHLRQTEEKIDAEIKWIHEQGYVGPYDTGDPDDGDLEFRKEQSRLLFGDRIEKLGQYSDCPYDYRVDVADDSGRIEYYLGMEDVTVMDEKIAISKNSKLGRALVHYRTTSINLNGRSLAVELKRAIEIGKGRLISITDEHVADEELDVAGIRDPFLRTVLMERRRKHYLTDIFVTIQEKQTAIVDAAPDRNLIVQGCAGSGKSVVMLHRLSALQYHNKDVNFTERAMIITPNDKFGKYLLSLAVNLHLEEIPMQTLEAFYLDLIEEYAPELKPKRGMFTDFDVVQQKYVDFVYSDKFLREFESAYKKAMNSRKDLVRELETLAPVFGVQLAEPYLDASDYEEQKWIEETARSIMVTAKREDDAVGAVEKEYRQALQRKDWLVSDTANLRTRCEKEGIPGMRFAAEKDLAGKRKTEEDLQSRIDALGRGSGVGRAFRRLFGRGKDAENVHDLQAQQQKLREQAEQIEEALKGLGNLSSADDTASWAQKIQILVPDAAANARNVIYWVKRAEKERQELAGMDEKIRLAKEKWEETAASMHPETERARARQLKESVKPYGIQMLYQDIFDDATAAFRKANQIKKHGNGHRFDLYARLRFLEKYCRTDAGNLRYLCIDEGQELSPNEYRLLKDLGGKDMILNIFGDTNQRLTEGRGIKDWASLQSELNADVYTLDENYRNTNQITEYCNLSFGMKTLPTGIDGPAVREIARGSLEDVLAKTPLSSDWTAILVPRSEKKAKYLKKELLPPKVQDAVGYVVGNGKISLLYVDEAKGIEFDNVYVDSSALSKNEKYVAYTRAKTMLTIIVNDQAV